MTRPAIDTPSERRRLDRQMAKVCVWLKSRGLLARHYKSGRLELRRRVGDVEHVVKVLQE